MTETVLTIKAKIQKAANTLITDAVKANSFDFTVFVSFSGNNNHLAIDVYPKGFDSQEIERSKISIFYDYLDTFPSVCNDQEILNNLREARTKLKKLINEESKKLWEQS